MSFISNAIIYCIRYNQSHITKRVAELKFYGPTLIKTLILYETHQYETTVVSIDLPITISTQSHLAPS